MYTDKDSNLIRNVNNVKTSVNVMSSDKILFINTFDIKYVIYI